MKEVFRVKVMTQLFAGSGVFPVHNNTFTIDIAGRNAATPEPTQVKDLETFSLSIDANVEEWTPMDLDGWMRRAVTGKGLTISFTGKRNYGDPGNDYVAETLLGTGQEVESNFVWTMPSGAKLTFDCIISLTAPGGGDSTNIDSLEFDLLSDGLPTFTPALP